MHFERPLRLASVLNVNKAQDAPPLPFTEVGWGEGEPPHTRANVEGPAP
jgi:hypothetical protein